MMVKAATRGVAAQPGHAKKAKSEAKKLVECTTKCNAKKAAVARFGATNEESPSGDESSSEHGGEDQSDDVKVYCKEVLATMPQGCKIPPLTTFWQRSGGHPTASYDWF